MNANIPDLVAKLKQAQAALGDGRDAKSQNELAEYWTAYNTIQRALSGLSADDVARLDLQLAELDARITQVVVKDNDLTHALATAPDLDSIEDAHERDKEHDRQRFLHRALQRLHEGTLLCAPDVYYEPLEHLNVRRAELQARRDSAQQILDYAIVAAQALLGELATAS